MWQTWLDRIVRDIWNRMVPIGRYRMCWCCTNICSIDYIKMIFEKFRLIFICINGFCAPRLNWWVMCFHLSLKTFFLDFELCKWEWPLFINKCTLSYYFWKIWIGLIVYACWNSGHCHVSIIWLIYIKMAIIILNARILLI